MNTTIAMPLIKEGETFRFVREERQLPPPAADEVRLRVTNCGVCGSDISRWKGGAYHYPIVIGHEFAGVVEYDPRGELDGRLTAVFPILPCHECEPCKNELYAMCAHYDYYGSRRDGAFATHLNVKRDNLILLSEGVDSESAAMCEPTAVALHALRRPRTVEGKRVAVYGAGTIGLLLLRTAKLLGAAETYCFDPDPDKLASALKNGALPLDDNASPDIFIDACGKSAALIDMLRRAKPRAEIVLLGNPSGDVLLAKADYWQILRRELTLYGTWNSQHGVSRSDWRDVLDYMADGRLAVRDLITHRFPLEQAEDALSTLASGKACKVMLKMEEV